MQVCNCVFKVNYSWITIVYLVYSIILITKVYRFLDSFTKKK